MYSFTGKSIKPGRTKLLTKLDNNEVFLMLKKQQWERQMGLN
jgi:ribosomal protein L24E